ncbi:MAG: DUF4294 domain-containing protein [Marinilabiliales bacterium]|nr:MAG: DUF4294 domain-containing protein [Marinilabiliales bacterium]
MKSLIVILLTFFITINLSAQRNGNNDGEVNGIVTKAVILDGDTVPLFWLPTVKIFGPILFKSKVQAITFSRMVRYVKRVYPYARFIGKKVDEYNVYLNTIEDKRFREKEINRIESELRAQFEEELVKLTFTQGKILLKLIYRETSKTTYGLITDYRGTLTAFFWQSLAKVFGYNLKVTYDPTGVDRDIENIVIMIENGTI